MTGANRLNQVIASHVNAEFERGVVDCTQFAIACEKAQNGSTRFPEFEGTYKTRKAGFAILLRLGFDNMWDCASDRLNAVNLSEVKRGDLIGHLAPDRCIGIACNKLEFWTFSEVEGLVMKPMTMAQMAWRL